MYALVAWSHITLYADVRSESLQEAYTRTKLLRDYINPKYHFVQQLAACEAAWQAGSCNAATGLASPSQADCQPAVDGKGLTRQPWSQSAYALIYLREHLQPYNWVPGGDLCGSVGRSSEL